MAKKLPKWQNFAQSGHPASYKYFELYRYLKILGDTYMILYDT